MQTGIPSAANKNYAKEQPKAVNTKVQPKPTSHGPYRNYKEPRNDDSEAHLTSKRQDGDLTNCGDILSSPGTAAETAHSTGDSLSTFHNQDLASSARTAATQLRTPDHRKRRRVEDEDELAMPEERINIRASPTAKIKDWELENWPAAMVEKQAASDPDFIRHLLDAAGPKIWALFMERTTSNTNFLRDLLDAGSSKAKMVGALQSEIRQEKESHQQKEKLKDEEYEILRSNFSKFKFDTASVLVAKADFDASKVADDVIKRAWNQLAYNIKNFVSNYLTERPQNEKNILDDTKCDQHAISMTSVKEKNLLRNNILRRHLWRIIYLHIFSGSKKKWYGEIGQALAHYIGQQDPRSLPNPQSLKMISVMKSIYDPALEKEKKISDDIELEELIRKAVADFQRFVPRAMMNLFEVDIKTILSEAVNIHTIMMKSKAIFIVQWIRDDDGQRVPYDSETMEFHQDGVDVGASDHAVHLVESPAVWKIGNADGENLDSSMVLLKSSVVLKEKKAKVVLEDKCTTSNSIGRNWAKIMRSDIFE